MLKSSLLIVVSMKYNLDFRFTDLKGMWHHVSYRMSAVNEGNLTNGLI